MKLKIIVFCTRGKGGTRFIGEGSLSRSVADATELPSAGKVAEGTGKGLRENHQAQP